MSEDSDFLEEQRIVDKLFAAIVLKQFKLARILADGGVDVTTKRSFGVTPLMAACDAVAEDGEPEVAKKRCELVKCLIRNGSEVDARDTSGRTAFHYACINGCKNVVRLLEENDADATIKDNSGKCPYFYLNSGQDRVKKDSIAKASIANVSSMLRVDSKDYFRV